MSEWQPIETAPTNTSILVVVRLKKNGLVVVGEATHHVRSVDEDHGWWWAQEFPGDDYGQEIRARGDMITHWQPLPQPPSATPDPHPETRT